MAQSNNYKLLLIAPAIDPNDVGEAFVGFKWAESLNESFKLTILTLNKKGHESIEKKIPGAEIISWNEPSFFWRFERFNSMFKPWYFLFYFKSRYWIKKQLLKNVRAYDLALQITPMAMRYPSPVSGMKIPYVIGPLGGGLPNLPSFEKELKKAPWYTKLRNIDSFRLRYDPILRSTYFGAEMIIGSAPHISSIVSNFIPSKRIEIINELGVEKVNKVNRLNEGTVNLLYVGRVIRTKGVRDLIRAIGFLKHSIDIQLDVVGDGEDLKYCKDEVTTLEIEKNVTFHGKLTRVDVNRFYEQADIFVFPSFREPTGGVIIEAMSYGLPQIVADYGGPASIVTNETGIKIKPKDMESYPLEIAEAIKILVLYPELRKKMSIASYKHIESNYLWKNKINKVSHLLKELIEKKVD